jgi:Flp pilus assembly pilin Flp
VIISERLGGHLLRLASSEGATAVEYGILVASIVAVLIVVIGALGAEVRAAFVSVMVVLTGGDPF